MRDWKETDRMIEAETEKRKSVEFMKKLVERRRERVGKD